MAVKILMNHCHDARSILLRVLGSCSKGSESARSNLPRRANCGVCPCCVRATHVPVPATYEVGTFDRRKANAVRLWQLYGPTASRANAAAVYFNQFGYLPSGWNWLATKHVVMLPPPLDPEGRQNVKEDTSRPCAASEPSESRLALEDVRRSRPAPMSPSPATSSFSPAPKPTRAAKPPPPIYPESTSPSPAKSGGRPKGSQSYGKSTWEGDWKARRETPVELK